MNTTSAYIINAILVFLVVRQIREHRMDLRGLAGPVLAVGAAAVLFLRSVPTGGNDLLLELACVTAGAVMGCLSGRFTHLRRGRGGQVLGPACRRAPRTRAPPVSGIRRGSPPRGRGLANAAAASASR